jgi:hypothetical protein
MKILSYRTARVVILCATLALLARQSAGAVPLKAQTVLVFDRYIDDTERRMHSELDNGPYLFVDGLPEGQRKEAYEQLREGTILLKQLNSETEGHPVEVPGGLIHDWIGVLFIPHVSLEQALRTAQDYDDYQDIYKPGVRRSKLLQRAGDKYNVFLQFYSGFVVTVVINAYFDITYERFGTDRVVSYSHSTRLAEVEVTGQGVERELSLDNGHGYLWRLDGYWRLQEKDGGVYVQLESIALTRGVPAVFGWLVSPLLKSVPRGLLTSLLSATRASVIKLSSAAADAGVSSGHV